jgi:urea carboxylase
VGAPRDISKVLIANRGEIACRIIRTLDRLGIASVAVYSDADRASPHVGMAAEAVRIGPPAAGASYLDGPRLLEAALTTGADAVHPGYGFLSENADFAAAIEGAGITFIGPTPQQIRRFGAKDSARALADAAGVPLLPGTGAVADVADGIAQSASIGFPLLVKSVAGGGGIGMLVCHRAGELADLVARAMRQSEQALGSSAVFLERLVLRARHIEVQAFGDGEGRVVVLGERDCSTQRRRQKVVEETPAPHLDDGARAALFDATRRLLEPLRYRSAGTVEFVLDADSGEFAFLEVNTRLQVEHGITEAVTGVDLVEWMVRVAAGDTGMLRDPAPTPRGHSIEVRVYAEDPAREFRPSSGLITEARWPEGARVDTWVRTGTEVTPHYDPMLAKLVVHADDRPAAIGAMCEALDATHVAGIETNCAQARSFIGSATFAAGEVTTETLASYRYSTPTLEVLEPGTFTTVQSMPTRVGYWHVGVPPSGPMDDRSFALGNEALGNPPGAAGLECTATGPTVRFDTDALLCLTGARMGATLDDVAVPWFEPFVATAGSTLRLGSIEGPGLRTYLLVRGGIDVPAYLGSRATFTLGGFGGHGGRALLRGDVLHLFDGPRFGGRLGDEPPAIEQPVLTSAWEIGVVDGPHGAPDFFTEPDRTTFFATEWIVHYNSSRTGVRLVGPRPEWARPDGGEAGLHPSNIHDTPYTVGAVDFTGDMPILLGPDGPSLGGFVCPVTVTTTERWKLGQLAPGDTVHFVAVPEPSPAVAPTRTPLPRMSEPSATAHGVLAIRPAQNDAPQVTYRRSGDRALLAEYGPMVLDIDLRLRAHALAAWVADAKLAGIVELTPGIRSLQVQVDGDAQTVESMFDALRTAEDELPALDDVVVASRTVHMPLSWDDPATREAIERYMRSVRDDAPWCPWNIEFIRRINGLDTVDDVRRIVFDAEYLVLGLGDVYLGAPVAVPVDPRHRLVTTKYNPARTWTPENAVGIGGAYLCVYGMEGPGGYQFVGRTVPVWSRYGEGPHFDSSTPWLLRFFDRIRWYPVDADTLLDMRAEARAGRLELEVDDGEFRRTDYRALLERERPEIEAFRWHRQAAFDAERAAWEAGGEFARVDEVLTAADRLDTGEGALGGPLPDYAVVVEASTHACVWRLDVTEGETVAPGTVLVSLEAMKLETSVVAPVGGTVARVLCREGQVVSPGAPLVVLVADG